MDLTNLFKGKKVTYLTDAKVEVLLQIDTVEEKVEEKAIESPSPSNDWWPETKIVKFYEVCFTTGFKKNYNSIGEMNIVV